MNQATIQRYQPGGDIYQSLAQQYGTAGANQIANAALSGDETQVNAALTQVKFGTPLNDSTASIFLNQIETNPLGAPLESLNNQLSTLVKDIFGNPFVLLALAAFIFFYFFNGVAVLRGLKK